MIIPAASTLVATIAPRERAGYALGMFRTVLYVGASIGPLVGGLVADKGGWATAWATAESWLPARRFRLYFIWLTFPPVS
jgi:MFS family permease